MEGQDDRSPGKKGKDKQRLLADGAVLSDDTGHDTLHSVSLDEGHQQVNPQSVGLDIPKKEDPSLLSKGTIQMTPLSLGEPDEDEEDNHEGPLLDPKTQPVNKLPKQEEEFDSYLTGWVRTLVIAVTSSLTFGLLGSTVVLVVCLMPGFESSVDTVAPVAAALLMISLMGSLIWCCWLGWNQCWFAATKDNLIRRLPFTRLHMLKPDELVKVKGRVALGPDGALTATYSHQMNCVYTEAYLYKQNPDGQGEQNWLYDIGERQAVDFFLVDDETGKSILVKAGYGAGITTIVPVKEVVETARGSSKGENKTPKLESWLEERDKTSYLPGEPEGDRRQEWLKFTETYFKVGDSILVVGNTERRRDEIVLVSPDETLSYGCKFWFLCVLPFHLRGMIISNESRMIGDLPQAKPVAQTESNV